MEIAISTKNLCKTYKLKDGRLFYASDNITIDIPKGRLSIFKGRSGSGKTTLMNMMSALDTPSSGEVDFFGERLSSVKKSRLESLRRFKMGFVFQSVALIPTMTAFENVDFALRLGDEAKTYKGKHKRHERIVEVLSLVGLEKRMNHIAGKLSGGEQQRVAIARAMVHHPAVIFADEPTGALDTATGLSIMKLFKDIVEQEGITIVMTTHDPNLMTQAHEIFELEDGKVVNHIINH